MAYAHVYHPYRTNPSPAASCERLSLSEGGSRSLEAAVALWHAVPHRLQTEKECHASKLVESMLQVAWKWYASEELVVKHVCPDAAINVRYIPMCSLDKNCIDSLNSWHNSFQNCRGLSREAGREERYAQPQQ